MDDSIVDEYVSVRRRKRFARSESHEEEVSDPHQDVARLHSCIGELTRHLPHAEKQRIDRVLAFELKQLLIDFCFDLSRHTHRDDCKRANDEHGILAAVNLAFCPFDEVFELFVQAGVGSL